MLVLVVGDHCCEQVGLVRETLIAVDLGVQLVRRQSIHDLLLAPLRPEQLHLVEYRGTLDLIDPRQPRASLQNLPHDWVVVARRARVELVVGRLLSLIVCLALLKGRGYHCAILQVRVYVLLASRRLLPLLQHHEVRVGRYTSVERIPVHKF